MLSSRIILALFLVLGTAVAVPLPQYDGSGYGDYETPQPPIVGRPRPQPGRTSSMSTTKFLGMMGLDRNMQHLPNNGQAANRYQGRPRWKDGE
ncbi:hypothetical protein F5878DRAFT_609146 [Lentinula raphanica]|uniref:Uncharacterized protein n=1 Tax=Lentinula raphanica TaxID=153919 RepID=A0AA38UHX5_9AGAR|nr:hypothetical protein F5880DRAFT_1543196 [Lentinula raphanica]KAJ3841875.1 hypothetical protein F5878DRAFT_609146 [Lentinula raphanica]